MDAQIKPTGEFENEKKENKRDNKCKITEGTIYY